MGEVTDKFDKALGALVGMPDVIQTAPATIRTATPLIGSPQTYIVQTFRQRDEEKDKADETVFVEYVGEGGATIRLVLLPAVVRTIHRQHDSLSARARSKAAKASADERKAKGIVPGFMANPGRGGRKH